MLRLRSININGGIIMIHLGICNVVGNDSWKDELKGRGYNPANYKCVTWHKGEPNEYDFTFRVRPHDPLNYVVKK
jgi:hypothetical protein